RLPDWLTAALLGAVQGATEFLPVSSSGHLRAFEEVNRYKVALAFDALLHLPTLLAVLIYFRREIRDVFASPERGPVLLRVVLGTAPAGAIALAFHRFREAIPPWFLVLGWSLSGTYLLLSAHREGKLAYPCFPLS